MRYYVHVILPDGVAVYGPYDLKGAKDFARIGSQHGEDRMVTRDIDGPVVRVYSHGYRRWPRGADEIDAANLEMSERPKVLDPYTPASIRAAWARADRRLQGESEEGGEVVGYAENPRELASGGWRNVNRRQLLEMLGRAIWTDTVIELAPEVSDMLMPLVPREAVSAAEDTLERFEAGFGADWKDVLEDHARDSWGGTDVLDFIIAHGDPEYEELVPLVNEAAARAEEEMGVSW